MTIISLLNNKKDLEKALLTFTYGTIEVRDNKYIYVHYRKDNKVISEYVDTYSEELYNTILNNNIKVKEIKKEIRKIDKELKDLGYKESELSNKTKLNIDFARKNLVDTIYKQSILEGITTTLADTETIIENGIVNGMHTTDVLKIINLKHAWDFILDENVMLSPTDFNLLSYINKLTIEGFYYNAGIIRTTPVQIGGTKWVPELPLESEIKKELDIILNKKISHIDKAIELLLYVMKKQIFIDGNKRTAVVYANHYLISKGLGLIVIPTELIPKYKELLISYYEGKNIKDIKEFLKTLCYIKLY